MSRRADAAITTPAATRAQLRPDKMIIAQRRISRSLANENPHRPMAFPMHGQRLRQYVHAKTVVSSRLKVRHGVATESENYCHNQFHETWLILAAGAREVGLGLHRDGFTCHRKNRSLPARSYRCPRRSCVSARHHLRQYPARSSRPRRSPSPARPKAWRAGYRGGGVRSLVREWRALGESNPSCKIENLES